MDLNLPRAGVDPVVRETRTIYRSLLGGGFADLRRMPSEVIFDEPKCTVHHYEPTADPDPDALPVLLIPPMAAIPVCFDLRRGCSMVEFLRDTGRGKKTGQRNNPAGHRSGQFASP